MPATATPQTAITVEVKNYRPARQLSEETEAFAATIYVNGKRAGTVSNSGHGGPHRYDFSDREVETAFYAYAREWAEANDESTYEPEDALISKLCEDIELKKQARLLVRRGAATVLLIEKGAHWFGEKTETPDFYKDAYLIGIPAGGQSPADIATAEEAERWRLISTD